MAVERQENNQSGLTREEKLQIGLRKIYPEQASEWSAKMVSFFNGEGRGNWKMVEVKNGYEIQYGKFLNAFVFVITPDETHFGTMAMAATCGKIENIVLVQEKPQTRSLTILMANDQNAKILVRKDGGSLCVCLSHRQLNGAKSTH